MNHQPYEGWPYSKPEQSREHQVFEGWLFSKLERSRAGQGVEPLSPEQEIALEQHLQTCESCRMLAAAWPELEGEMRQTPVLEPAPGFSSRWLAIELADRRRLERRQALASLAFTMGAAVLLGGSLLILSLPVLRTPANLFWAWVYEILNLVSWMDTVQEIGSGLARSLPVTTWVLLAGLVSQLAVLWVVSLRVITNPRRVTK